MSAGRSDAVIAEATELLEHMTTAGIEPRYASVAPRLIRNLLAVIAALREEREALRAHHRLCQCPVDGHDGVDCTFRLSAAELTAEVARLRAEVEALTQEATILQDQIDDHYIPRVVHLQSSYDSETGKLGQRIGKLRAEVEARKKDWTDMVMAHADQFLKTEELQAATDAAQVQIAELRKENEELKAQLALR